MIYAASGHRARTLGTHFPPKQLKLVEFAQTILREYQPTRVISGMALGWDQAVARAVVREGIPFDAFVPFEGQESRWGSTDRAAYKALLAKADGIQIGEQEGLSIRDRLMVRNEAMVDQAQAVLALWDGRDWGGTFQCLKYAQSRGVRVYQLFQHWQDFIAP